VQRQVERQERAQRRLPHGAERGNHHQTEDGFVLEHIFPKRAAIIAPLGRLNTVFGAEQRVKEPDGQTGNRPDLKRGPPVDKRDQETQRERPNDFSEICAAIVHAQGKSALLPIRGG